jgi:NitT/TauT family transport system substrate-binding protein
VTAAWPHLAFSLDPLAATLKASAEHQQKLGLASTSLPLNGIYDLTLLNQVLADHQRPAVSGL